MRCMLQCEECCSFRMCSGSGRQLALNSEIKCDISICFFLFLFAGCKCQPFQIRESLVQPVDIHGTVNVFKACFLTVVLLK